jgi:hypothetical protein
MEKGESFKEEREHKFHSSALLGRERGVPGVCAGFSLTPKTKISNSIFSQLKALKNIG